MKKTAKKQQMLDPIPPGEILLEDFMKPMGISINLLAREIGVPPTRISDIVNGKRSITADTALRLGRFFGITPGIWTGLQADYDLQVAQRDAGKQIEQRVHVLGPNYEVGVKHAVAMVREKSNG
jgi:addiction module HigA family antidote